MGGLLDGLYAYDSMIWNHIVAFISGSRGMIAGIRFVIRLGHT